MSRTPGFRRERTIADPGPRLGRLRGQSFAVGEVRRGANRLDAADRAAARAISFKSSLQAKPGSRAPRYFAAGEGRRPTATGADRRTTDSGEAPGAVPRLRRRRPAATPS